MSPNAERRPPPQVSVVVVNWNRRELLRACLRSLQRQSFADFEVIVVDNGSSDGSADMVEQEFAGGGDARFRVIRNRDNLGFCAANNQGIAASRSPLVALLNNDAEADPEWLEEMVKLSMLHPEAGMIACKILTYEDPRRIDKVGHLIYPDGQNRGRGAGEWDMGQYDVVEEVAWPDGCACMFRREALEECGGFDEDFYMFGDDAELGLRLRIAGWKCLYVPTAVVKHHRGGSAALGSTYRLYMIERNRVLLALKLFPWRLLVWNIPYYFLRLLAGVKAAAVGRGEIQRYPGVTGKLRAAVAMVKGDLAALLVAPRILRKRKDIGRIARLKPADICALIQRYRIPLRELVEKGN